VSGPHDFKTLGIIWMAMLGGTIGYTVLAYLLLATDVISMRALSPDVMNVVGAAVLVQLMASLLVRRRMIRAIPDDAPREVRAARYFNATIVGLALLEAGGLMVITVAMATGAATWALAGGGAAAVLMLLARPSPEELGG